MNICIIFFSATKNTKLIASIIAEQLEKNDDSVNIILSDVTPFSVRERKKEFEECDKFIFGFPVYGWRAPSVIRSWLKNLKGKGRECAMFFTYGGINPGVIHFDTYKILEKQNFKVISSAEFPSSHSYNLGGWNVLEKRPDKEDLNISRQYAEKILKTFKKSKSNSISFEAHKYSDQVLEKISNNPKRLVNPPKRIKECSLCKSCEELCPSNAIDAENGKIDENKCIRCLSCVLNCPDNALVVNDLSLLYKLVLRVEHLTEGKIKNRKSKIFT